MITHALPARNLARPRRRRRRCSAARNRNHLSPLRDRLNPLTSNQGRSGRRAAGRGRHATQQQFRLHRRGVDPVGVQTFSNCLCLGHEAGDVRVRDDDVRRGDGLLLVEAPDVELVDRDDAGDLGWC